MMFQNCRTDVNASEAVLRVSLSLIFLVAGTGHLLNPVNIVKRLNAAPLAHLSTFWAPAEWLVFLAGIALVIGGIGLASGTLTRWSAILLIAVLIPITATVQLSPATLGPLFKNVAILGGLFYFAVNGARVLSVDAALSARRRVLTVAETAAGGPG